VLQRCPDCRGTCGNEDEDEEISRALAKLARIPRAERTLHRQAGEWSAYSGGGGGSTVASEWSSGSSASAESAEEPGFLDQVGEFLSDPLGSAEESAPMLGTGGPPGVFGPEAPTPGEWSGEQLEPGVEVLEEALRLTGRPITLSGVAIDTALDSLNDLLDGVQPAQDSPPSVSSCPPSDTVIKESSAPPTRLSGKTLEEICEANRLAGDPHVQLESNEGICGQTNSAGKLTKLESARPVISIRQKVSTWAFGASQATPAQKALILKLLGLINAHEARHVEIYKRHFKDVHLKMLRSRSVAGAQQAFVKARCDAGKEQDRFDNAEGCLRCTKDFKDVVAAPLKDCGLPTSNVAPSHCKP
jgi:hypothetical protein